MAGMTFCSEDGIARVFGPACGALAFRVAAGQVPALGVRTH